MGTKKLSLSALLQRSLQSLQVTLTLCSSTPPVESSPAVTGLTASLGLDDHSSSLTCPFITPPPPLPPLPPAPATFFYPHSSTQHLRHPFPPPMLISVLAPLPLLLSAPSPKLMPSSLIAQHGDDYDRLVPTQIRGIPRIAAISAGGQHSLLLSRTRRGKIKRRRRRRRRGTTRKGSRGQLGLDDGRDYFFPTCVMTQPPLRGNERGGRWKRAEFEWGGRLQREA
eukprot:765386-Hanusia_phi.AAC.4